VKDSREAMLSALRRQRVPPQPLPPAGIAGIQFRGARDQFIEVLQSVGGTAQRVADATALVQVIAQSAAYRESVSRGCAISLPGGPDSSTSLDWNVSLNDVDDPHDLATLDFAVLPGHFGVAENGAVWVTDHQLRHRVVYFIARRLALVVPAAHLVHNMHEAYERISFVDNAYGCFISGPSKTADIEQSLVIGAHGARSLAVYLVDDAASCRLGR
jgi:L-lactate dehydrogenase complex protein LldG